MRKRIAKKKRVGRFRELGFEAAWRYRGDTSSDEIDSFWDAFIERIEERGLVFGAARRLA